jgi:dihydropteroate synthase
MAVLNVTPDSFYDGGRFTSAAEVQAQIASLLASGADLLDIGGESSRPGATPVSAGEQLDRVEPAIRAAVSAGARVSIDTTLPAVAERALGLGAQAVNDVSCLADPDLARVAARAQAVLVLMHTRGTVGSMAGFSEYPSDAYGDVVGEVSAEWCRARDRAVQQGMPRERILFDPGLGFAKNGSQSLELLARLHELAVTGAPIVVGPSRKSFIATVDPSPPEERLGGTIAACLLAAHRGASVLRVHDVRTVKQALLVARAIEPGAAVRADPAGADGVASTGTEAEEEEGVRV